MANATILEVIASSATRQEAQDLAQCAITGVIMVPENGLITPEQKIESIRLYLAAVIESDIRRAKPQSAKFATILN